MGLNVCSSHVVFEWQCVLAPGILFMYGSCPWPLSTPPCVLIGLSGHPTESHTHSFYLPWRLQFTFDFVDSFLLQYIPASLICTDCNLLSASFFPPVNPSLFSSFGDIINLASLLTPYVTMLYVTDLLCFSPHPDPRYLPPPSPQCQAGTMAVWVGSRLRLSCSAAGKPASWWETANQEPANTLLLWSECTLSYSIVMNAHRFW